MNVDREIARMTQMTVDELQARFAEIFGEQTNGRHKVWLTKRIAWRMQANAEGGLSERARRRAMELANDADLRVTAPRKPKSPGAESRTVTMPAKIKPKTDLLPGTVLQRPYKGNVVRVNVLADGFEYAGERYKSLTAVAKAVTGKHWNGFHFFGLRQNGSDR